MMIPPRRRFVWFAILYLASLVAYAAVVLAEKSMLRLLH
jgi:hypothetical protein